MDAIDLSVEFDTSSSVKGEPNKRPRNAPMVWRPFGLAVR